VIDAALMVKIQMVPSARLSPASLEARHANQCPTSGFATRAGIKEPQARSRGGRKGKSSTREALVGVVAMKVRISLNAKTLAYPRTINERRGATRRSSEFLLKSERPRDSTEAFGEACMGRAWDLAPAVVKAELHIAPLTGEYQGVYFKTYPDGQAWLRDGSIIVREVKPQWARRDAALQSRYAAIAQDCAARGLNYKLIYGDDLMRLPRRHNIDLLLRARESSPSEPKVLAAGNLIRERRRITIADLRAMLGLSWLEALSLVALGVCHIDLNLNFNATTELHADDLGAFAIYL
jgi:hypothetical protein